MNDCILNVMMNILASSAAFITFAGDLTFAEQENRGIYAMPRQQTQPHRNVLILSPIYQLY